MRIPHLFLVIIFASFIVFGAPVFFRLGQDNATLIGEYPYSYLTSSPRAFDIFGLFVSSLHLPLVGYWFLSIAGTLLFVFLFYRLVRLNCTDMLYRQVTLFLIFVTPITLYLAHVLAPYLAALILITIGLNLFHSRLRSLAFLPFTGLLFFDWLVFLSASVIVTGYLFFVQSSLYGPTTSTPHFRHSHKRGKAHMFFLLSFVAAFIVVHFFLPPPSVLETLPQELSLTDFFSDFGSIHGFGIFVVLLSFVGIVRSWAYKRQLVPAYLGLCLFVALFFFLSPNALIFLYPFVILFAASALVYFWRRTWYVHYLRFLTLAILIYGAIFSGFSYAQRIAALPPDQNVFDSMQWLRGHASLSEVVLSHPQKGFWIAYGSGLSPFIDYLEEDYPHRIAIAQTLFASRDLKKTTSLLEANNISIIWIDNDMKNGQVWTENDEGILFLFRNERFKKVYSREGIEIWRFG